MPMRRRTRRSTRARRPAGRYRRRFTRRRTFRRRAPRRIVPNVKRVRLRYAQAVVLNPPAGSGNAYAQYTFRSNDLYDPDVTGTGNQPLGYDEWSRFYPNWIVLGSKIRVTLSSSAINANGIPAVFGVFQSSISGSGLPSITNPATLVEQPGVSWRQVSSWSGSSKIPSVSCSYSPRKYWAGRDPRSNIGLWGQTSSSPGYQNFYVVWAASVDGATDLDALYGMVTIDYIVEFRDPTVLPQS